MSTSNAFPLSCDKVGWVISTNCDKTKGGGGGEKSLYDVCDNGKLYRIHYQRILESTLTDSSWSIRICARSRKYTFRDLTLEKEMPRAEYIGRLRALRVQFHHVCSALFTKWDVQKPFGLDKIRKFQAPNPPKYNSLDIWFHWCMKASNQ